MEKPRCDLDGCIKVDARCDLDGRNEFNGI